MRILVTGGSGFVGQNILKEFGDKYTLFAPSHKELDLTDFKSVENYLEKHKITHVIHTAIKGGDTVLETTLRMFVNLLQSLDRLEKIIHLGSGAEYGKTRDLKKVKEEEFGTSIPEDSYGLAKYCCSLMSQKEKKIVTLRLFGIYGEYEDYRYKFISNAIVKNLLGIPIKIKQDVVFDYLYIHDFLSVIEHFLLKPCMYQEYNITPTRSIRLTEIVQIINRVTDRPSRVTLVNKGYNFQYTADNTRLKSEMPNLRFTSYEEGIRRLFLFYKKNLNTIDKETVIEDDYFQKCRVKGDKKL